MFLKYFNYTTAIRLYINEYTKDLSKVVLCETAEWIVFECRRHFITLQARVPYKLSVRRRNRQYASSRQFVVLSVEA